MVIHHNILGIVVGVYQRIALVNSLILKSYRHNVDRFLKSVVFHCFGSKNMKQQIVGSRTVVLYILRNTGSQNL